MSDLAAQSKLRNKAQSLRALWKSEERPCIICGIATVDSRDHLPPKVLFPRQLRDNADPTHEFFTYPVCRKCNGASSDGDFILSSYIAIKLNQQSIATGVEPTDSDQIALWEQFSDHIDDDASDPPDPKRQKEIDRRRSLLAPFISDEESGVENCGLLEVDNQWFIPTLLKTVKALYWLHTGGDILENRRPGWWIRSNVDTSKAGFVNNHLKKSNVDMQWGNRFVTRYNVAPIGSGAEGMVASSLSFYTNLILGNGLTWFLVAAPTTTEIDGQSLYELVRAQNGEPTVFPNP